MATRFYHTTHAYACAFDLAHTLTPTLQNETAHTQGKNDSNFGNCISQNDKI